MFPSIAILLAPRSAEFETFFFFFSVKKVTVAGTEAEWIIKGYFFQIEGNVAQFYLFQRSFTVALGQWAHSICHGAFVLRCCSLKKRRACHCGSSLRLVSAISTLGASWKITTTRPDISSVGHGVSSQAKMPPAVCRTLPLWVFLEVRWWPEYRNVFSHRLRVGFVVVSLGRRPLQGHLCGKSMPALTLFLQSEL